MNFDGNFPLVGGRRFGVSDPNTKKEVEVVVQVVPVFIPSVNKAPAPQPAPCYPQRPAPQTSTAAVGNQCGLMLSATKLPLHVGDYVRGSDKTKNVKVNSEFRGHIIEFIPPTPTEGNNVRVKCCRTGKVFRVKNNEIRSAR